MIVKQPLFSILIANYNNGKYLAEAIESVFSQAYKRWEIIIVDDKSTDDSELYYQKYDTNPHVKIFRNVKNCGCGYTKRRCIEEAKGELCGFLDPDDVLHPQAIEEMVLAHSDEKDVSLAYSTHFVCDESLNPKASLFNSTHIPENESHLTSQIGNISHFVSFKRGCYLRTSGIDPALKRAVDQDLYYKLEEQGKVLFIDKPLYYYRHHANSISLNENLLKAQYWNLVAATDAYKRRRTNSEISNLTKREIEKRWFSYFLKKAIYHSKKKRWRKMYSNLFRAGKYIKYDRKLSIIRIGLVPFK